MPPDAPEEMARVARATTIPIAAGERLATKYDFARVLREEAAAILQMNLGRVGGILEAKKIAAMAEVSHVQLAPHLYCGPVVGAANIQLATCSPNFLILESIERWQGFHADILMKPVRWKRATSSPRPSRAWAWSSTRQSSPATPTPAPGCTWRWRRTLRPEATRARRASQRKSRLQALLVPLVEEVHHVLVAADRAWQVGRTCHPALGLGHELGVLARWWRSTPR